MNKAIHLARHKAKRREARIVFLESLLKRSLAFIDYTATDAGFHAELAHIDKIRLALKDRAMTTDPKPPRRAFRDRF